MTMKRILPIYVVAPFFVLPSHSFAGPLSPEQRLGSLLFQDKNLSLNRNQSCSSCHALNPVKIRKSRASTPGFVDPDNVLKNTPVSRGSIESAAGSLNAPSIGYAAFSPDFHFDDSEGLFVGAQFWNGRAKNLIDQAKQPFLNPVEMAMPSASSVINRLRENDRYIESFKKVFGLDLQDTQLTLTAEGISRI